MSKEPGWEAWESFVNEQLGLRPTPGSGNQWYSKGDGIDGSDSEYAVMVESKYTEKASFSINTKLLCNYRDIAFMAGRKFALCVRLWGRGQRQPADFAVIPFDMFVDLIEKAKEWEKYAGQT